MSDFPNTVTGPSEIKYEPPVGPPHRGLTVGRVEFSPFILPPPGPANDLCMKLSRDLAEGRAALQVLDALRPLVERILDNYTYHTPTLSHVYCTKPDEGCCCGLEALDVEIRRLLGC